MARDKWTERLKGDGPYSENDVRSEWDRDHARLIHSAAFRRLQAKTQVLGLGESDFYRTRLTHSLEVAQIGVGIVRWLKEHHKNDPDILAWLPTSALMNSICLAHDIGHPPFGHGGEVALNLCMRDHGGFEGNGQTLRILSKLDKYTKEHGMNPTRRLLLGVLKYPASYSQTVFSDSYGEVPSKAWLCKAKEQHPPKCYLDDEAEVVSWVLDALNPEERTEFVRVEPKFDDETGAPKHYKPIYKGLDTSIMELADDISYSLHDLEDAISLGMVTRKDWDEHNAKDENQKLFCACELNADDIGDKLFSAASYERKREIGKLVHKFIISTKVQESGLPGAVTPLLKWNAVMQEAPRALMKHIFDLVLNKVIKSPNVQQLEFKGQKLVVELFEALSSDPLRLLSSDTKARYDSKDNEDGRMRVISDFIAGMTDEYATRFYEKLYYPHKGSIFDRL